MSFAAIFSLSGQSMITQTVRLGLSAKNLAYTNAAARSEAEVYRPQKALLQPKPETLTANNKQTLAFSSVISGIARSQSPPVTQYSPDHPLADENGKVYYPNISLIEEMAETLSAARAFDAAVKVYKAGQQMHNDVLNLISA